MPYQLLLGNDCSVKYPRHRLFKLSMDTAVWNQYVRFGNKGEQIKYNHK